MTRVIGGTARGRRLVTPAGVTTRPTSDRAREGLFNTLGNLAGLTFLDLYAGTGAVGLEASSRGAASVTLVESDRAALTAIATNLTSLTMPTVSVAAVRVGDFLAGNPVAFDVVFMDPPFQLPVAPVLAAVAPFVGDRLVVERASASGEPTWPAGIELIKSRTYGAATLWYGAQL